LAPNNDIVALHNGIPYSSKLHKWNTPVTLFMAKSDFKNTFRLTHANATLASHWSCATDNTGRPISTYGLMALERKISTPFAFQWSTVTHFTFLMLLYQTWWHYGPRLWNALPISLRQPHLSL